MYVSQVHNRQPFTATRHWCYLRNALNLPHPHPDQQTLTHPPINLRNASNPPHPLLDHSNALKNYYDNLHNAISETIHYLFQVTARKDFKCEWLPIQWVQVQGTIFLWKHTVVLRFFLCCIYIYCGIMLCWSLLFTTTSVQRFRTCASYSTYIQWGLGLRN
jgi:hypothetical protein